MAQRIARVNRTANPTVRHNRTPLKIVVQFLVRDSPTLRRIAPDSQTATHDLALPKTGMCRDPVVRTMPARTMAARIMLPAVPMRMLLGQALLKIGPLLRKLATLLGTTVVQPHRRIAMFRLLTIKMFPVRRLQSPLSSSRANTRVHGRRTIVLRNRHKRDLRTIALRKISR